MSIVSAAPLKSKHLPDAGVAEIRWKMDRLIEPRRQGLSIKLEKMLEIGANLAL